MKLTHRIFLITYLYGGLCSAGFSQVAEEDSLALVALYEKTNGPSWSRFDGWLEEPVNDWYGITVEGNWVTQIILRDNNLKGAIPDELWELARLKVLDLQYNSLSGGLSDAVGQADSLVSLRLSHNLLDGSISNQISNCQMLSSLYLNGNELIGSIPEQIGNCKKLIHFICSDNELSGGIPSSFIDLEDISLADLSHNNLSGELPENLENLKRMEILRLNDNGLTGAIPQSITKMSRLEWLDLSNNQLSGELPTDWGNLAEMKWLSVSFNEINGEIPESIAEMTNLTWLSLTDNNLCGTVPPSLGNLRELEYLFLGRNKLHGTIPASFENFDSLQDLSLYDNFFTGAIPEGLANLEQITHLSLFGNYFNDLPDFSDCPRLKTFDVSDNILGFDAILKNLKVLDIYSPQRRLTRSQIHYTHYGDQFSMSLEVGVYPDVSYTLYKDEKFDYRESSTITFNEVRSYHAGIYEIHATHSNIPDLKLQSGEQSLCVSYLNVYNQPEILEDDSATILMVIGDYFHTPRFSLVSLEVSDDIDEVEIVHHNDCLILAHDPNFYGGFKAYFTISVEDTVFYDSLDIFIQPVNDPPVIAVIGDVVLSADSTKTIRLSVEDIDGRLQDLGVRAFSERVEFFDESGLSVDYMDSGYELTMSPLIGSSGETIVTVEVIDEEFVVSKSFLLTVLPSEADPLSTRSVSVSPGWVIYPNPIQGTSSTFALRHKYAGRFNLEIRDITGKLIIQQSHQKNTHEYQVEIGNLPMGIYFGLIRYADQVEVLKIIRD